MNDQSLDTPDTQNVVRVLVCPRDQAIVAERMARREALVDADLIGGVQAIFSRVKQEGDRAVLAATRAHDGVELGALRVPEPVIGQALTALSTELRAAIEVALARIEWVNRALMPRDVLREMEPGVRVGELYRPLDSVALWIPCRKGPLLSTALMLVTAARVAGVERISVLMPPRSDGTADPGTLAAARLAGAHACFVGNGVALLGAATQGTGSVPRVAGVFGPGPGAIAVAMAMAGMYGLKTVAGIGPTDCAVLADDSADARLVAWDLASEAEHGPDSAALLATPSAGFARAVAAELATIIEGAEPGRRENLRQVFGPAGRGMLVVSPDFEASCELAARFAPEHLSVVCRPERRTGAISSAVAGELLLGSHTPFAAANYAIGITAVLPTNGAARSLSGITARDMLRTTTLGELDQVALSTLVPTIATLARYEGLPCHAAAAEARGARSP
ncbi:MAG TPA: histidinol dehydrogenase [Polyangiaceae bacterium]|nr:histidinol dehydrogenase [Polyangiaceae bacterium]